MDPQGGRPRARTDQQDRLNTQHRQRHYECALPSTHVARDAGTRARDGAFLADPLWVSSSHSWALVLELSPDLAGDVVLEAASDLAVGSALGSASRNVRLGGFVISPGGESDHVAGPVELAVAVSVEAVTVLALSRVRGHRSDALKAGVGRFGSAELLRRRVVSSRRGAHRLINTVVVRPRNSLRSSSGEVNTKALSSLIAAVRARTTPSWVTVCARKASRCPSWVRGVCSLCLPRASRAARTASSSSVFAPSLVGR